MCAHTIVTDSPFCFDRHMVAFILVLLPTLQ